MDGPLHIHPQGNDLAGVLIATNFFSPKLEPLQVQKMQINAKNAKRAQVSQTAARQE
jgi:hypothetical protein